MIDIKLIRDNPDIVRENIKKKFQDAKLPLVDEVIDLDNKNRAAITEVEALRAKRTTLSKQVGVLMGQGRKDGGCEWDIKDGGNYISLSILLSIVLTFGTMLVFHKLQKRKQLK